MFPDKAAVFFEPAIGAEKVRAYVIGRMLNGVNTSYSLELIHETEECGIVYDYVRNVPPHMLSKAQGHPYPTRVTDMKDVRVRMDLPAHAFEKKRPIQAKEASQSGGAPKRRRIAVPEPQDQGEATDAEDPSSPVIRHAIPELEPDDAMAGAEEQPAPVENEMEEQGVAKEVGEVEEGEIKESQIDVILDPFTQAIGQYADPVDEDAAGTGNETSTHVPSKGPVFTFGAKPLTHAVSNGAPPCAPGEEEATLRIEEASQGCSQGTFDISPHLKRQ